MNVELEEVRRYAAELKRLLIHYASQEPEAAMCLRELAPLIDDIIIGIARLPVKHVSCGWHFVEGGLRKYSDLEDAYAKFVFSAAGGDERKLHRFFQSLDADSKVAARMLSPDLTWREKLWSGWSRLTNRRKR